MAKATVKITTPSGSWVEAEVEYFSPNGIRAAVTELAEKLFDEEEQANG
jgi:hypothetical protein